MIFIKRENLCVIHTDTVLDAVSKDELKKPLLERPGNVVYFETVNGMYGIVSSGDAQRAEGDLVKINKSFTRFDKIETMAARQFFRSHLNVGELPALENGRLVGEFQSADDELLLDRAVPFSRNAYAPAFFGRLRNIALVRPAEGHGYKLPYFERMKEILDAYHAEYTVLSLEEMIERIDEFDRFLLVDQPEQKGALFALYLFKNIKYTDKIFTYYGLQVKLESSEVMDYGEVFRTLRSQGVETILLSAETERKTEYFDETNKAIRRRFPAGDKRPAKERAIPYYKTFFDDLYSRDGYVESIINQCFVLENCDHMMRLRDTSGKYLNIRSGERRTVGQPEDYERTIFFYGPCLVVGNFVADEYTIESWLQKRFIEAGMKVRVVNCGSWGDNVSILSRIVSTRFHKGDIVVALMQDLNDPIDGVTTFHLWEALEKHRVSAEWLMDSPFHVNHHATKVYADELFSLVMQKIKSDTSDDLPIIYNVDIIEKFFIKKYFYGVDLEKYDSVAVCMFNANPFTSGHRYLVETAAKAADHVYLLIVRTHANLFSFGERYSMAVDSLRDLENVTVIPSGIFIGNAANFPGYFVKQFTSKTAEQCRSTIRTFAALAASLHATHVFLGEEPADPVTMEVNRAYLEIMPQYGIRPMIVPRKTQNGEIITGSMVRALAEERSEKLREYVPAPTADIIFCETINVF